MTPAQWKTLQVGDILKYIGNTDYVGTLCAVVDIPPSTNNVTLKIISPGVLGYNSWGNDSAIADGWSFKSAFKFTLHSTTIASLPERINQKIKALDTEWVNKQKEKGNAYALLLL